MNGGTPAVPGNSSALLWGLMQRLATGAQAEDLMREVASNMEGLDAMVAAQREDTPVPSPELAEEKHRNGLVLAVMRLAAGIQARHPLKLEVAPAEAVDGTARPADFITGLADALHKLADAMDAPAI